MIKYVTFLIAFYIQFLTISGASAFQLTDTTNTYMHVIISHDDLVSEASRLSEHRNNNGTRSCVVKTSDLANEFGAGQLTVQAIRDFVTFAYENWRIAPSYLVLLGDANHEQSENDMIPAHYNISTFGSYPRSALNYDYPNDYYYVEPLGGDDKKPIIHVGRIPARTIQEAKNLIDKILSYESITGSPTWLRKALVLVGDVFDENAYLYREASNELVQNEFIGYALQDVKKLYADDYFNEWGLDYLEIITDTVRTAINSGYGFINATGQMYSWEGYDLVACVDFDLFSGGETFTESLVGTNFVPLLFVNSCITNFYYWDWDCCVGEDFLMAANDRGGIAVVAPTHTNYFIHSYEFNKQFLRKMLRVGLRDIGNIVTATRVQLMADGWAVPKDVLDVYALLGDPATQIQIAAGGGTTESISCGFEIEETPVFQDSVVVSYLVADTGFRIIHDDNGLRPVEGERMVRTVLNDENSSDSYCEWLIRELNLPISSNMILSFWINVLESPGNIDGIVVDGNTTAGRLSDISSIVDQHCETLDASSRSPLETGWQYIYADLTAIAGDTLLDLRVVYDTPGETGELLAYVDGIKAAVYGNDDDIVVFDSELMNAEFELDYDGNSVPDYWTNSSGEADPANVTYTWVKGIEGNYMVVNDAQCDGTGALQVFHVGGDVNVLDLHMFHRAPEPTTLIVKILKNSDQSVVACDTLETDGFWRDYSMSFNNPITSGFGVLEIVFTPGTCNTPIFVDDIRLGDIDSCIVSGFVKTSEGFNIEGMEVHAIAEGTSTVYKSTMTDDIGYYEIILPESWAGSVNPISNGYYDEFVPEEKVFNATNGLYAGVDFTASHRPMTWQSDGSPICDANGAQSDPQVTADGSGGAIAVWVDDRVGNKDIYAQKMSGNGDIVWGVVNGTNVCGDGADQIEPDVISDGQGGGIITWVDSRDYGYPTTGKDIYVQRIDSDGNLCWGQYGFGVCTRTGDQTDASMCITKSGGAIVVWKDTENDPPNEFNSVRAQHLSTNCVPIWETQGKRICELDHDQITPKVCDDGSGGAFIAWRDKRAQLSVHLYATRIDSAGTLLGPTGGVAVATLTGGVFHIDMIPDGNGNAYVAWRHDTGVYVQKLMSSVEIGWPSFPNGRQVFDSSGYVYIETPVLALDDEGGVYVAWMDSRNGVDNGDMFMQRIDGDGSIVWNDDVPVCTSSGLQDSPKLVQGQPGYALLCWRDSRDFSTNGYDIYAQIVGKDGSVVWTPNGTCINNNNSDQNYANICEDQNNGAIIAWQDDRSVNDDIYSSRLKIALKSGVISSPEIWSDDTIVTGDIFVTEDTEIQIEAGTDVFICSNDFDHAGEDTSRIEVNIEGTIDAGGTAGAPVRFVAWGNGTEITEFGSWVGFHFDTLSTGGSFDNCIVESAERAIETHAPVYLNNCTFDTLGYTAVCAWNTEITMLNSTIANSNAHGVVLNESDATINYSTINNCSSNGVAMYGLGSLNIRHSTFENNDIGLYVYDNRYGSGLADSLSAFRNNDIGIYYYRSSAPDIEHCIIEDNTTDGIYCDQSSNPTISYCITSQSYDGKISNNGTGVYCNNNSSPSLWLNTIRYNQVGIGALNNSNPDLGHESGEPFSIGNNIIGNSGGFHVFNLTPSVTIMAENNYWIPLRSYMFSGAVDYNPYLRSAPNPTSEQEAERKIPSVYALSQNYPNPFNPVTMIRYQVPPPGANVRINIFNVAGQLVKSLVNKHTLPGYYVAKWNGLNNRGESVASSVYFVKMSAGQFTQTKKIVLIK